MQRAIASKRPLRHTRGQKTDCPKQVPSGQPGTVEDLHQHGAGHIGKYAFITFTGGLERRIATPGASQERRADMLQAGFGFATVQRVYAMVGAFFLPLLAIVLLCLNRRRFIGEAFNRPWTSIALVGVLVFFAWAAVARILG